MSTTQESVRSKVEISDASTSWLVFRPTDTWEDTLISEICSVDQEKILSKKRKSIGITMALSKFHHSALESATNQRTHTNAQTTELNAIALVEFISVTRRDLIMEMKSLPSMSSKTSIPRLSGKKVSNWKLLATDTFSKRVMLGKIMQIKISNVSVSHSLLLSHTTVLMMAVIANAQVEIFSMVRNSRVMQINKSLLSRKCLMMENTWSPVRSKTPWNASHRALLVMSFSRNTVKMVAIAMIWVP